MMALGAVEVGEEVLEPRFEEGLMEDDECGSSEGSSFIAWEVLWKTVTTIAKTAISHRIVCRDSGVESLPWNSSPSSIILTNWLASVGFLPQRATGKGDIVNFLLTFVAEWRVGSI